MPSITRLSLLLGALALLASTKPIPQAHSPLDAPCGAPCDEFDQNTRFPLSSVTTDSIAPEAPPPVKGRNVLSPGGALPVRQAAADPDPTKPLVQDAPALLDPSISVGIGSARPLNPIGGSSAPPELGLPPPEGPVFGPPSQ